MANLGGANYISSLQAVFFLLLCTSYAILAYDSQSRRGGDYFACRNEVILRRGGPLKSILLYQDVRTPW